MFCAITFRSWVLRFILSWLRTALTAALERGFLDSAALLISAGAGVTQGLLRVLEAKVSLNSHCCPLLTSVANCVSLCAAGDGESQRSGCQVCGPRLTRQSGEQASLPVANRVTPMCSSHVWNLARIGAQNVHSDVTFLVEDRRVFAHRVVLVRSIDFLCDCQ